MICELQAGMTLRAASLVVALIGVSSTSAWSQTRAPTHVACVGDSIAAGNGSSSSAKSYPGQLQTMFGSSVQVNNFGHSGATMLSVGDLPYIKQTEYTAATTFVSNAGANAVVDVIIMLGTNDSKSYNWTASDGGTRMQAFMDDVAAMADHFANLSTHPVVYLALPPAVFTNTYGITDSVIKNEINPLLKQVAGQKGMPTIDVYTPTAGHSDYFPDGVHPNDGGYTVVAKTMFDGLRANNGGGTGGSGGGGATGGSNGGGAGGRGGVGGRGGRAGGGGTGSGGSGIGGGSGGPGNGTGGGGGSGGTGSGGSGSGGTGTGSGGTGSGGSGSGGTGNGTGGTGIGSGGTGNGTGGTGSGGAAGKGTTDGDSGCAGCSVGTVPAAGFLGLGLVMVMLGVRRSRRRG